LQQPSCSIKSKNKFSFGIHAELDYFIESTIKMIAVNPIFIEFLRTYWFSSVTQNDFKFIYDTPRMRIQQEKLIFKVWNKEFKKGKYTDLNLIKLLLASNDWSKSTDKKFLFASMKDSVTKDSLRLS